MQWLQQVRKHMEQSSKKSEYKISILSKNNASEFCAIITYLIMN